MNPGGEPERDDTGLPPVDVEIPDDARDLDRDVHAYRRELRALRRSDRRGRWHRWLSRDGVVLPLLACCLVLALITGTLLTVFTATSSPISNGLPGPLTTAPARSGPPAVMVKDTVLPDAVITVRSAAVPVQSLKGAMLVLVPPGCGCAGTFRWLAQVASTAGVPAFAIFTPATKTEVATLYGQLGSRLGGWVYLAEETDRLLSPARVPPGLPAGQLTAILVAPDHVATWVSQLSPGDNQAVLIQALTGQPA